MKKMKLMTTLLAVFTFMVFCRVNVSAVTGSGMVSNPYVLTSDVIKDSTTISYTIPTSWKNSGYTYFKIYNSSIASRSVKITNINAYNCYYRISDSDSNTTSGFTGSTNFTIASSKYCYLRFASSGFTSDVTVTLTMGSCSKCSKTLTSDAAHDSTHTTYGYVNEESKGHYKYCQKCVDNGHYWYSDCGHYSLENHTMITKTIDGVEYNACKYCDYVKSSTCLHTSYTKTSGYNTPEYCGVKCSNCNKDITSIKMIKHTWGKRVDTESGHEWKCTNCGYVKSEHHKYVTTYKVPKTCYDSVIGTVDNYAGHNEVKTCSVCGDVVTNATTYDHTYSGWKCTKCGYNKGAKLKAPKVTYKKQSGKKKTKKYTVAAHWEKISGKWYWIEKKKHTSYTYKVTVKYKKVAGAKGYVVSDTKMKTGEAAYYVKKGLKQTVTHSSTDKKLKMVTVYIAAVNSQGIVGKVTKKVVKVK